MLNQDMESNQSTTTSDKIVPFSLKQRRVFSWWHPDSPVSKRSGIIADGSIRAGKTFPMALSFVEWSFYTFKHPQLFAICGKTVGSIRRNVLWWLVPMLMKCGYTVEHKRGDKVLLITSNGLTHTFYYFGGKDEASADLIQGVTLAGVLFDEVALMPQSFVLQATGRCSVEGSKYWFNCNPGSPSHWFKTEWLDKCDEMGFVHIHFTMGDNPSLSPGTRARYESLYRGSAVFYKRMILGLWVMAEGAIYDMWTDANEYNALHPRFPEQCDEYVAIDYGTQNPMVFLHVLHASNDRIFIDDEYFYDGRKSQKQKTDSQYADDLDAFCQGKNIRRLIIDPSAASFIAECKLRGYLVKEADNAVEDGIRLTASMIALQLLKVNRHNCPNLLREVTSYSWDNKLTDKGKEQPIKRDDHCMDAKRYACKTIIKKLRYS